MPEGRRCLDGRNLKRLQRFDETLVSEDLTRWSWVKAVSAAFGVPSIARQVTLPAPKILIIFECLLIVFGQLDPVINMPTMSVVKIRWCQVGKMPVLLPIQCVLSIQCTICHVLLIFGCTDYDRFFEVAVKQMDKASMPKRGVTRPKSQALLFNWGLPLDRKDGEEFFGAQECLNKTLQLSEYLLRTSTWTGVVTSLELRRMLVKFNLLSRWLVMTSRGRCQWWRSGLKTI